jgi:hypothetical protein
MQCEDIYCLFVAWLTHTVSDSDCIECNDCWNDSELNRIWKKGVSAYIKLLLMQLAGFTK